MDKEIRLVNNVEGSIVSDAMLNKVDVIQKQAVEIGQLKGDLRYANDFANLMDEDHARELSEASTTVRVEFSKDAKSNESRSMILDMWGRLVYRTENDPQSIKSIVVDKIKLEELASAAAIGEAKKKEDAAQEKLDKAEVIEKRAKDMDKLYRKDIEVIRKDQKNAIERAVEYSEKKNVKEIKALELDIKALMTEADLLVDERSNLAKERDLAFETMDRQLNLYKNLIDILKRPAKTIVASINARLHNWYFTKRINRLNS